MVEHPAVALRWMFWPTRAILFAQLFVPVVLVCVLAPGALLMAVPALGLVLLHSPPLYLYHRHWIAPALPFILMATVLGCGRVKRYFARPGRPVTTPYAAVLAAVLVGCAVSNVLPNIVGRITTPWGWPQPPEAMRNDGTIYDPVFYRHTERSRNAWALIRQIPPEASVSASGDLLVPLSARSVLYEVLDDRVPWRDVDYVLINTRLIHLGAGNYRLALAESDKGMVSDEFLPELHRRRVTQCMDGMLRSGLWTLVDRQGDISLLRRVAPAEAR